MDQLFGATTTSYEDELTEGEDNEKAAGIHTEQRLSKVSSQV